MKTSQFLLLFVLPVTALVAPFSAAGENVEVFKEVAYGIGGIDPPQALYMDIARPKNGQQDLPCVLLIHGGGWAHGSRQDMHDELMRLASKGYVTASVSYRLAPQHKFPAAFDDCRSAVRFLRANAPQWGMDPDRMAAVGFSAGAHLAMMLGTEDSDSKDAWNGAFSGWSSKVQAVVSFVGPTDLTVKFPPASEGIVANFLGGSREEKAEEYKAASPAHHVDSTDAPMLLFQGTQDELVPYDQAIRMLRELDRAQVPGRVELLLGLNHGLSGKGVRGAEERQRATQSMDDFLAKYLHN